MPVALYFFCIARRCCMIQLRLSYVKEHQEKRTTTARPSDVANMRRSCATRSSCGRDFSHPRDHGARRPQLRLLSEHDFGHALHPAHAPDEATIIRLRNSRQCTLQVQCKASAKWRFCRCNSIASFTASQWSTTTWAMPNNSTMMLLAIGRRRIASGSSGSSQ